MDPSRIEIIGPLAEHVEGLWLELLSQGYTPLSSMNLVRLMSHLSRWLKHNRLSPDQLNHEQIEKFLRHRKKKGYTHFCSKRALKPILDYLKREKILLLSELVEEIADSPLGKLLDRYALYLKKERALRLSTVRNYVRIARQFLEGLDVKRGMCSLSSFRSGDLSAFVLRELRSGSVGSAKNKVTALRSILRYLYVHGDISTDVAVSVPSVAGWRQASLPKAHSPKEARRLVRSCDRRTHVGRRDFAAILLMLRLGLRVGEVATLELDDIHWVRGEITVKGKGKQEDLLPLPEDVGEALVSYIRLSRPRIANRKVFVRIRAPHEALSVSGLQAIVRKACEYAGIASTGSHRLRHTAATSMLRQGVPLSEIAQVLRHRHLDTTAIYAKVDRNALRLVVQPWPRGGMS